MTEHDSFVHNLQIATPCKADWSEMSGDERKRFCGACKLHVYNISEMTLAEAEALIIGADGARVCVRLFRRDDGTVLTQDCPVGLAAKMKSRVKKTLAYVSAAAAIAIGWGSYWRQASLESEMGRASTCSTGETKGNVQMGGASPRAIMGDVMVGSGPALQGSESPLRRTTVVRPQPKPALKTTSHID